VVIRAARPALVKEPGETLQPMGANVTAVLVILLMMLVLPYTNVLVFTVLLLGLGGAGAVLLIDHGIPNDLAVLAAFFVVFVVVVYRLARPRARRRTFRRW